MKLIVTYFNNLQKQEKTVKNQNASLFKFCAKNSFPQNCCQLVTRA